MLSTSSLFTTLHGLNRVSYLGLSAFGDGQKISNAQAARLPANLYLRSMNRISMMRRKFLGSGRGAGERTVNT